jgi:hypothetical protein
MVKKLNTVEFINKANKVHANKYNYSSVEYINSRTKIKIICVEHGEFEQIPNNHLNGSGCYLCEKFKAKNSFKYKASVIHANKYDYSLVNYINNKIKIKIICPKHGLFEQTPNDHLNGSGCYMCGNKLLNNDIFIERANKIHNYEFDYSLVNYINNKSNVDIICNKHGVFSQRVENHLNGAGCPECKQCRGEREIKKYLVSNSILFIEQKRFLGCKYKKTLPFDFYLPEHNICIEFNGRQHYVAVEYWGGDKTLKKQQERDEIKKDYCIKENIQLIVINNINEIKDKLICLVTKI